MLALLGTAVAYFVPAEIDESAANLEMEARARTVIGEISAVLAKFP
jgi:hypothetical protein